jgi:hypothetical protein
MPWLIATSATLVAGACASALSEYAIVRLQGRNKMIKKLLSLPKMPNDDSAPEIDWGDTE